MSQQIAIAAHLYAVDEVIAGIILHPISLHYEVPRVTTRAVYFGPEHRNDILVVGACHIQAFLPLVLEPLT